MSEKINVYNYEVDNKVYDPNRELYMGFLVGLGYDPFQMSRAPLSSAGYTVFRGRLDENVNFAWNSPEDWEAILNTLPLVQI